MNGGTWLVDTDCVGRAEGGKVGGRERWRKIEEREGGREGGKM